MSWRYNPNAGFPGGLCYVVPQTGDRIPAQGMRGDHHQLVNEVVTYLHANGLHADHERLVLDIMEQNCSRHPQHCTQWDEQLNRPAAEPMRVTFARLLTAARTMLAHFMEDGGQRVSVEEANRRSSICLGGSHPCPEHVDAGGCSPCNWRPVKEIINRIVGGAVNDKLKSCRVCGCSLNAKIHLQRSTILRFSKDKYPENCWLHETNGP